MHGHWTVTVTNPDGSVDAVHEFENDLTPMGKQLLEILIAGETKINDWEISAYMIGEEYSCAEEKWKGSKGFNKVPSLDATVTRIGAVQYSGVTPAETFVNLTAVCTATTKGPAEVVQVSTTLRTEDYVQTTIQNPTNLFSFTHEQNLSIPFVDSQVLSFNVMITFGFTDIS